MDNKSSSHLAQTNAFLMATLIKCNVTCMFIPGSIPSVLGELRGARMVMPLMVTLLAQHGTQRSRWDGDSMTASRRR
uniref:Uncharacterized protein n=1 Tax=Oryza barthii TaxID=65489 RepID=A0A0D3FD78_9ORYZ